MVFLFLLFVLTLQHNEISHHKTPPVYKYEGYLEGRVGKYFVQDTQSPATFEIDCIGGCYAYVLNNEQIDSLINYPGDVPWNVVDYINMIIVYPAVDTIQETDPEPPRPVDDPNMSDEEPGYPGDTDGGCGDGVDCDYDIQSFVVELGDEIYYILIFNYNNEGTYYSLTKLNDEEYPPPPGPPPGPDEEDEEVVQVFAGVILMMLLSGCGFLVLVFFVVLAGIIGLLVFIKILTCNVGRRCTCNQRTNNNVNGAVVPLPVQVQVPQTVELQQQQQNIQNLLPVQQVRSSDVIFSEQFVGNTENLKSV